ncbi:4-hydroxybenzoate polyprenyltransferase [uncultured Bifidobacterium sp.]|uniref:4-hydroxybenzoate polyprenyltransferase n=1 Tax=uncultured Bifidobacterium sp. TaxID=165187 RepID=UPI0026206786|nr:4-hydroxybenzoate polyprenyltransferase [uncultured Bifidobacterium sp.]
MPLERNRQESRRGNAPLVLAQNVVVACVLCAGEIIAAPLYMIMINGVVALVPWMMVACLVAVAFAVTAGFALLWLAQSLSARFRDRYRPLVAAVCGFVGFGLWGFLVVVSLIDSLVMAQGGAALAGGQTLSVGFNSAVWGFLAFGAATMVGERLSRRPVLAFVAGAVVVLMAGVGLFYAVSMFSMIY